MQSKQELLTNNMTKKTIKGGAPKRQEFYYEKIARENARRFIDESSLSQRAVAKQIGMNHYQELNNMLRGSTTILNQIPALARILGKSECDFFKDPAEQNNTTTAIAKWQKWIDKLILILESGDDYFAPAIIANLGGFSRSIELEKKDVALKAENAALKEELNRLKKSQQNDSDFKTSRKRSGSTA